MGDIKLDRLVKSRDCFALIAGLNWTVAHTSVRIVVKGFQIAHKSLESTSRKKQFVVIRLSEKRFMRDVYINAPIAAKC